MAYFIADISTVFLHFGAIPSSLRFLSQKIVRRKIQAEGEIFGPCFFWHVFENVRA